MLYLLLSLVALGIICAVMGFISYKKGEPQDIVVGKGDCSSCTGDDPKCEQICMMEAAVKAPEYYDDEELDAFRGRPSDGYSEEEAAMFADVMYTMRPDEVKGWNRSLILRGINMPDQIKDEFIALATD